MLFCSLTNWPVLKAYINPIGIFPRALFYKQIRLEQILFKVIHSKQQANRISKQSSINNSIYDIHIDLYYECNRI